MAELVYIITCAFHLALRGEKRCMDVVIIDFASNEANYVHEACWSNAAERGMFPAIACLAVVIAEQGSETDGF